MRHLISRSALGFGLLLTGCQNPIFQYRLFPTKDATADTTAVNKGNQTAQATSPAPAQSTNSPTVNSNQTTSRPQTIQQTAGVQENNNSRPAVDERTRMEIQRASDAMRTQRYTEARVALESVLAREPQNMAANHLLAQVSDQQQRWTDAEQHYLNALSQRPDDPNILSDMGYSYMLQGRYADAKEKLQRAIQVNNRHQKAILNMGAVHAAMGDRNAALYFFRQVMEEPQAMQLLSQELERSIARAKQLAKSQPVPNVELKGMGQDALRREMARIQQDAEIANERLAYLRSQQEQLDQQIRQQATQRLQQDYANTGSWKNKVNGVPESQWNQRLNELDRDDRDSISQASGNMPPRGRQNNYDQGYNDGAGNGQNFNSQGFNPQDFNGQRFNPQNMNGQGLPLDNAPNGNQNYNHQGHGNGNNFGPQPMNRGNNGGNFPGANGGNFPGGNMNGVNTNQFGPNAGPTFDSNQSFNPGMNPGTNSGINGNGNNGWLPMNPAPNGPQNQFQGSNIQGAPMNGNGPGMSFNPGFAPGFGPVPAGFNMNANAASPGPFNNGMMSNPGPGFPAFHDRALPNLEMGLATQNQGRMNGNNVNGMNPAFDGMNQPPMLPNMSSNGPAGTSGGMPANLPTVPSAPGPWNPNSRPQFNNAPPSGNGNINNIQPTGGFNTPGDPGAKQLFEATQLGMGAGPGGLFNLSGSGIPMGTPMVGTPPLNQASPTAVDPTRFQPMTSWGNR